MSTNYYWKHKYQSVNHQKLPTGVIVPGHTQLDDMSPIIHIGKRSGAGPWCRRCNITLCKEGVARIHYVCGQDRFYEACPECNASRTDKDNKNELIVQPCCSFTWAQDPKVVKDILLARPFSKLVSDEYRRTITCWEFLEIVESCPIHYCDAIGQPFC